MNYDIFLQLSASIFCDCSKFRVFIFNKQLQHAYCNCAQRLAKNILKLFYLMFPNDSLSHSHNKKEMQFFRCCLAFRAFDHMQLDSSFIFSFRSQAEITFAILAAGLSDLLSICQEAVSRGRLADVWDV